MGTAHTEHSAVQPPTRAKHPAHNVCPSAHCQMRSSASVCCIKSARHTMHSVRSSSDMAVTVNGTVTFAMTSQDGGRRGARRA